MSDEIAQALFRAWVREQMEAVQEVMRYITSDLIRGLWEEAQACVGKSVGVDEAIRSVWWRRGASGVLIPRESVLGILRAVGYEVSVEQAREVLRAERAEAAGAAAARLHEWRRTGVLPPPRVGRKASDGNHGKGREGNRATPGGAGRSGDGEG